MGAETNVQRLRDGNSFCERTKVLFFQTCRDETLKTKLRIVSYNLSLINIHIHSLFPSIHPYPYFETNSWGVNTSSLWEKACNRLANIFRTRAATLFTVNKNGFTPFANSRCQSLLQTTSMGSYPLLMVDVKVYCSKRAWVHTLC